MTHAPRYTLLALGAMVERAGKDAGEGKVASGGP